MSNESTILGMFNFESSIRSKQRSNNGICLFDVIEEIDLPANLEVSERNSLARNWQLLLE
jgi:hypothetical protein